MELEDAAEQIFKNPRRRQTRDIARTISDHSRKVIVKYAHVFDVTFWRVVGSVGRETHLPDISDLDIILLPLDEGYGYRSELPGYWEDLSNALAQDTNLVQRMSVAYAIGHDRILDALKTSWERDDHQNHPDKPDLVTGKLKIDGRKLLEVTAGNYYYNRVSLVYSDGCWQRQREMLRTKEREELVLAQVCLAKAAATFLGYRGNERGQVPSRALEQLVMSRALQECERPLYDAMKAIDSGEPEEIAKCLAFPVPFEFPKAHGRQRGIPTIRPETWVKLRALADKIVFHKLNYDGVLKLFDSTAAVASAR